MTGQRSPLDEPAVRIVRWADVARVLTRGAVFSMFVTLLAVAIAVVVTRLSDPVYRASVSLVASQSPPRFEGLDIIAPPAVDPSVYRSALYEGDVLRRAFERVEGRALGEVVLDRLSDAVRVTIERQELSAVLRIDVRDSSAVRAAAVANAIAEELVAWDRQRARQGLSQGVAALERAITAIDTELLGNGALSADRRATLTDLQEQRSQELAQARDANASAVAIGLIEPLREATPPERPVGPRLVLNVAIAAVLGLIAGYGSLLVGWTANPRVFTREDLERLTTLPVLAVFPTRRPGTPRLSEDAASLLRTKLTTYRTPGRALFVVVTGIRSTADHDGVAVGLAESFARIGDRTLLVDADLRHARASAWLEVSTTAATPYDDANLAREGRQPLPAVSIVVDANRSFDLVPAFPGAPQPVDRLVQVFRRNRDDWMTSYDVVVVNAAPIFPNPDVLAVVPGATGAVLCVRAGHTSRRDLDEGLSLLTEQGVTALGTVLTHAVRRPGRAARSRSAQGSESAEHRATANARSANRRG